MATYKIIGVDRKEYGPIGPEQIRLWLAEGRLNGQTLVLAEGATEWKPLGALPEFADALRAQTSSYPPAAGAGGVLAQDFSTAEILSRQPQVHILSCLTRGWALVTSNAGLLFGSSLV